MVTLYEKLRRLTREDAGDENDVQVEPPDTASVSAPRVLVLGTKVASREVTSHEWDDIPATVNMTDFDAVIMDYAALQDDELRERIHGDALPDPRQMIRHFFHKESLTIIVGPPVVIGSYEHGVRHPQWFLPFEFVFVGEEGSTIGNVDPLFEEYFETVDRWSWYVTNNYQRRDADFLYVAESLHILDPRDVEATTDAVATNAKEEAIAFAASATIFGLASSGNVEPVAQSGDLIWLPEPTKASHEEAIEILLSSVFGLEVSPPSEPDWLLDYTLPNEEEADRRIERIRADLRAKQLELSSAKEERKKVRIFHTMLYDRGESLEQPVRDALRVLGADVHDPEERGGNDGMLSYRDNRAVLEIKGRKAQVGTNDVRQLRHWVSDAEAEDPDWDGKGILIGNAHNETPPAEREEDPFDANAARIAKRWGISLVTTTQVFRALQQKQAGTFDQDAFWTAIFEGKGTVVLPELETPTREDELTA